ncbi:MAG: aldehyde dehydrogenase family protein, partial [Actinobacteria bacterium]|nr:aldehyde dehydrogenase family protein [Actinomycetota bacterium]
PLTCNEAKDPMHRLRATIPAARIARYDAACVGTAVDGVQLYRWANAVALAVFDHLGTLEIAMRSAMARELESEYGVTWFRRTDLLDDDTLKLIDDAWRVGRLQSLAAPPDVLHGKLVATLIFGFWVKTLGRGGYQGRGVSRQRRIYDTTLWKPALRKALPQVGDFDRALVETAARRVQSLRNRIAHPGDGTIGCDMGPIVTEQARDRITGYIAAGEQAGADLVIDGRQGPFDGDPHGYFVGPTLFDNVATDMSIYTDEIFGPVLSVVRVSGFTEGLDLINASPYGNGSVIFTNDGGAARRFEIEVQAGMVGINVPVPVPMAYYSFGGWKDSLFGDSHAHGTEGVHFYTRSKTVTRRWPDPSHRGL